MVCLRFEKQYSRELWESWTGTAMRDSRNSVLKYLWPIDYYRVTQSITGRARAETEGSRF